MRTLDQWWFPLKEHREQSRLFWSPCRHRVLPAGRGSGKTEVAARILVGGDEHHRGAICPPPGVRDPLYVVAAPTRDQVKSIWWPRLKAMIPPELLVRRPLENDLTIELRTGAHIRLVGLDKPHRVEGVAIDGLVVDEYAEVREDAWGSSLEPACNRLGRPGWALFIGRPKGRNHFYTLFTAARADREEWDGFHWTSSVVLDPLELEKIRQRRDVRTFRQEYLADFVTFEGQVYYQYEAAKHLQPLAYQPGLPLVLFFDFNVSPGTAGIVQEQLRSSPLCLYCGSVAATGTVCPKCGTKVPPVVTTCCLDEIYEEHDSNTAIVCNRIGERWGKAHRGKVFVYGDPSGRSRQTSAESTDYAQIREYLSQWWPDIEVRVKKSQPHQVDRINAINNRLCKANGIVQLAIDPRRCPHTVLDFEGVVYSKNKREIDKDTDKWLTHLTDGLGYYLDYEHSPSREVTTIQAW